MRVKVLTWCIKMFAFAYLYNFPQSSAQVQQKLPKEHCMKVSNSALKIITLSKSQVIHRPFLHQGFCKKNSQ